MTRNKLDLAIGINLLSNVSHIKNDALFQDHYSFYIHSALKKKSEGLPLIWFPEADYRKGISCYQHLKRKIKTCPTFDCENMETVKELTQRGVGVGLLPSRVASPLVRSGRLKQIELPGFPAYFGAHDISIIYNEQHLLISKSLGLINDIKDIARSTL